MALSTLDKKEVLHGSGGRTQTADRNRHRRTSRQRFHAARSPGSYLGSGVRTSAPPGGHLSVGRSTRPGGGGNQSPALGGTHASRDDGDGSFLRQQGLPHPDSPRCRSVTPFPLHQWAVAESRRRGAKSRDGHRTLRTSQSSTTSSALRQSRRSTLRAPRRHHRRPPRRALPWNGDLRASRVPRHP